ncbi:MAG: hypothetical protein SF162_08200 [bacterium]|nr:hypothetical protein [bacterium]
MSIRLDWEIEAEHEHLRTAEEDPEAKRRRRIARTRFLILLTVVVLLIGAAAGSAALRLRYVDWQIEQQLRDTVAAEVATLRIGDLEAYLRMQRSASDAWLQYQQNIFAEYQALKTQPNTALTGTITGLEIDGTRARVQLQEVVGGVPYELLWFYWRYEDGWRHVPLDTTFWGESRTLTAERVTVRYFAVDQPMGQQVSDRFNGWIDRACGVIDCAALPSITIEIVPDSGAVNGWVNDAEWRMRLASPLIERMPSAQPFVPSLQLAAASALAERLTGYATDFMQVMYPADAYYLRQAFISYLVGRMTGTQTNSFLLQSLERRYGEAAVRAFADVLQPGSSMAMFAPLLNLASPADADLDWRDLLTWRLALENELIARGAQAEFLSLYDTADPAVSQLAVQRYFNGGSPSAVVTEAIPGRDAQGNAILETAVSTNDGTLTILFRMVDGVWKRAN